MPNDCDATNIKSAALGKCENIHNGKLLTCGRVRRALSLSITSLSLLVLCIISVTCFLLHSIKSNYFCYISTIRISEQIHSSLCDILPRFAEFLHCVNKDKNTINLEIFSLETKKNCQFIYNCNAKSKLFPIAICNVTLTVCSPLIVLSCVAKKFSNFPNTSNRLPSSPDR